eukprot:2112241-Lingulodinium_polyedra.AAC.1
MSLPTIPRDQLTCEAMGASGYMLSRGEGWSQWELKELASAGSAGSVAARGEQRDVAPAVGRRA